MKVKKIIEKLQQFNPEDNIDVSDKRGTFFNIKDVELQEWKERNENEVHRSVTLILDSYNKQDSLCVDETFITKVNAQLPKDSQINIKEAMEAKKVFDEEQIGKKAMSDYNTFASKIHKLLFGSDNLLQNRSISNLKQLVYANNWDKEFDVESTNNRQEILSFLYHKLDEAIAEKIKEKNNINEGDIPKVNKDYIKDNSASFYRKLNPKNDSNQNNAIKSQDDLFDFLSKAFNIIQ